MIYGRLWTLTTRPEEKAKGSGSAHAGCFDVPGVTTADVNNTGGRGTVFITCYIKPTLPHFKLFILYILPFIIIHFLKYEEEFVLGLVSRVGLVNV